MDGPSGVFPSSVLEPVDQEELHGLLPKHLLRHETHVGRRINPTGVFTSPVWKERQRGFCVRPYSGSESGSVW